MALQRRMAYAIVEADNPQELAVRVSDMMGKGFVPNGGIFATGTIGLVGMQAVKFYQTMILVQEVEVSDEEAEKRGLSLVPKA